MEVIQVLLGVFRFYDDVKAFLQMRQVYTDEQWAAEGNVITKAIKGAPTDAERRALVKRLADHLTGA